jgi:hypothetical protein
LQFLSILIQKIKNLVQEQDEEQELGQDIELLVVGKVVDMVSKEHMVRMVHMVRMDCSLIHH